MHRSVPNAAEVGLVCVSLLAAAAVLCFVCVTDSVTASNPEGTALVKHNSHRLQMQAAPLLRSDKRDKRPALRKLQHGKLV